MPSRDSRSARTVARVLVTAMAYVPALRRPLLWAIRFGRIKQFSEHAVNGSNATQHLR